MTVMVVAHPIPGFNGRQYVDDVALTFVGGFAKADVPTGAQADLTARGYTLNAVPASNYDPRYVTQDDLETPTSAASVALKAAFVSRRRRQVAGSSAFPSSARNVTNSASNTQVQQIHSFVLTEDVADLAFTFENAYRSSTSATNLVGLADVTVRLGLWDGGSTYPVWWRNGTRDMTLKPGGYADTAPIPAKFAKGQRLWMVRLMTWGAAPANFPAATVFAGGALDVNEWGTALTDRTSSYGKIFTRSAGNYAVLPPIAITATAAAGPVVAIIGDSISSDAVNDYFTSDVDYGWAQGGLGDAGIPHVNLGNTGWQLANLMSSKTMRAQLFPTLLAAGVTHALVPLGTNDLASGQTAAQLIANLATLKSELDPLGIKVIPCTMQPRTDATNTGAAPNGEANTIAQRASFNSQVVANNGVGYGYFDLAAFAGDPANSNRWNTGVRAATGISIVSGGSGYTSGDILILPGGGSAEVAATAGVVTSVSTSAVSYGGWLVDPPAAVSPVRAISNSDAARGIASGKGATFSYTGVGPATSLTSDGEHPSAQVTRYLRWNFAAAAPGLFKV